MVSRSYHSQKDVQLSTSEAVKYSALGPTLRASGVKSDVRVDDPYAAYDELPLQVVTYDGCDVASRLWILCDEILVSIQIIRYAIEHLPDGAVRRTVPRNVPEGEALTRVEAPRGEDIHYVRADGTDKPARLKVRAPTLANLLPLCHMFTGMHIADIPVVIAGIDPCIACTERFIVFDRAKKTSLILTREDLRLNRY